MMNLVRTLILCSGVLASLSGCGTEGPLYGSIKASIPRVSADKVVLTFYRQSHWAASIATVRVQVEDVTVGELPNGALIHMEHAPGTLHIRIEREGILGVGHADA